jgi:hypothetical protein
LESQDGVFEADPGGSRRWACAIRGVDGKRRVRLAGGSQQDLPAGMNPSPYERTSAFIRSRDPVAIVGIALAAVWAVWVIYYLLDHRRGIDWFLLASDAVSKIGAGVLLAAGLVSLIGIVSDN